MIFLLNHYADHGIGVHLLGLYSYTHNIYIYIYEPSDIFFNGVGFLSGKSAGNDGFFRCKYGGFRFQVSLKPSIRSQSIPLNHHSVVKSH